MGCGGAVAPYVAHHSGRLNVLTSASAPSHFDLAALDLATLDLAILGADAPLADAFLAILEEREIPLRRLYALTFGEEESSATFQGMDWPYEDATAFDYRKAHALVVMGQDAAARRLLAKIRSEQPHLPILDVNDTDALIDPAPAQVAARLLRPINALAGLVSAEAFVTLPVALAGKAGIDELAEQTRSLFNMQTPESEVFPLQIAFNLLPVAQAVGPLDYESRLAQATMRLSNGLAVGFTAATGSLFFGAVMALHVRTEQVLDIEKLRHALQHKAGITLMEADLPAAMPSPATDAQGSQDVFVGRIRVDGNAGRFWLVFDPIALEAAQVVTWLESLKVENTRRSNDQD